MTGDKTPLRISTAFKKRVTSKEFKPGIDRINFKLSLKNIPCEGERNKEAKQTERKTPKIA